MDLTDEELIGRVGTKLADDCVEQIIQKFKSNAESRSKIRGCPKIGTNVNGYKVLGHLGTGGFGTVCLVSQGELYFAMKCSSTVSEKNNQRLKCLFSDLHDNLLTSLPLPFNWKNNDDLLSLGRRVSCTIMKLSGPDLGTLLREKSSPMNGISQRIRMMQGALRAVEALHALKLVHYDVKLDNFGTNVFDVNRIFLIDYDMIQSPPRVCKDNVGFKGTRRYGSRRALDGFSKSYRDDAESWFNCVLQVYLDQLPWISSGSDMIQAMKDFWRNPNPSINKHFIKIMRHIENLDFRKSMNFEFVYGCLQDFIDETNGVSFIPFVYAKNERNCMKIVHAGYSFRQRNDSSNKKTRFICNGNNCNFSIYVEKCVLQDAAFGEEAMIIDTLNHHTCGGSIQCP